MRARRTGPPARPPKPTSTRSTGAALSRSSSQPLGSEVLLGPGDYLVTAELDSAPWSAVATISSGQRTALALAPGFGVLDEPVWLRYPMPAEDVTQGCSIEEDDPVWLRHQRDIARRDLDRSRRSRPSHEWTEFLAGRPEAGELSRQIELAGPLTGDWTASVLALSGDTLEVAVDLLLEMDIKDFYEMSAEDLPAVLGEIVRVRDTRAAPDSLWNRYVLSPRLYFQEGTMRWWTELPWLGDGVGAPAPREVLSAFRAHVTGLARTQLGAIAAPEDTWRSGYAAPPDARACLVGLLRRHGIPARAGMGVDYVEAWEDGGWTRLDTVRGGRRGGCRVRRGPSGGRPPDRSLLRPAGTSRGRRDLESDAPDAVQRWAVRDLAPRAALGG